MGPSCVSTILNSGFLSPASFGNNANMYLNVQNIYRGTITVTLRYVNFVGTGDGIFIQFNNGGSWTYRAGGGPYQLPYTFPAATGGFYVRMFSASSWNIYNTNPFELSWATSCYDPYVEVNSQCMETPTCSSTPGQYVDTTYFECASCAQGTYSTDVSTSLTSCSQCPAGSYSAYAASTSCTGCAAGKYSSLAASPSKYLCTSCQPGSYAPAAGYSACVPCPAGTYNLESGGASLSASCTPCAAGYFSDALGATSLSTCKVCGNGNKSSVPGSSACTPCSPGTFSLNVPTTGCTKCPAGSYLDSYGKTACTLCEPGKYSDTNGSSACTLCPVGTFNSAYGLNKVCAPCPNSTFSTSPGASACDSCPVGTTSYAVNAITTACTDCSPGSYVAAARSAACTLCPAGYVQINSRSTTCISCTFGTFAPSAGSTICADCKLTAEMWASFASAVCTRWTVRSIPFSFLDRRQQESIVVFYSNDLVGSGSYALTLQPYERKRWIIDVPSSFLEIRLSMQVGTSGTAYIDLLLPETTQKIVFADGTAWFSQQVFQSPDGYVDMLYDGKDTSVPPYSITFNWTATCYVGYAPTTNISDGCRCTSSNATLCLTSCGPGRFYSNVSQLCASCYPGSYSNVSGGFACDPCLAGTYSYMYGATYCRSCQPGKYVSSAMAGATGCAECTPGSYADQVASTGCKACSPGLYSNQFASL